MNPRLRLNGPLAWSAASLLVIVVLVVLTLPALARAAFGPDLDGEGVSDTFAKLMEEHEGMSETYRDRFDGRSVFFKPPRKPKRRPVRTAPPPKKDDTPKPPPPPKPDPKRPPYSGPSIGGMIGDRVYFEGDLRVDVGEERDGVEVLSVNPPWGAKVMYRKWEYDLDLFEHGEFFDAGDEDDRDVKLGGFIDGDEDESETPSDKPTEWSQDSRGESATSGSSSSRSRRRAKPAKGRDE